MTTEPSSHEAPTLRWRPFPAVAIIAMGVLFLLGNLGYEFAFLRQGNWWAVFILLSALAPLTRAWELYRAHGRFDASVVHFLVVATAVAMVGVMFLARLDWSMWWPLFVILGGLYMLVPRHRHHHRDRRYWRGEHPDDATARR